VSWNFFPAYQLILEFKLTFLRSVVSFCEIAVVSTADSKSNCSVKTSIRHVF